MQSCERDTELVHVPTESWTFLRATLPLLILSNIAAIGSTFSAGERRGEVNGKGSITLEEVAHIQVAYSKGEGLAARLHIPSFSSTCTFLSLQIDKK